ncbi:MAG: orotidine-5'-phosphate decarboxylase [Candidatus Omnitrophica bacterium]|nr:orotidine-5'-phosphate decarboxylase [Candidatus Omnitrophota bacterium]
MKARDRLIVALDVPGYEEASTLVDKLSPEVDIFKVGIAPFTGYGHKILEKLKLLGKKVFLDLKVHDIPNTVRNAARAAAERGVFMMNFHCLGGATMMESALQGAREGYSGDRAGFPLLLGVTVLTSMDKETMNGLGMAGEVEDKVVSLARSAKEAGLHGVVASAKEAAAIKNECGNAFKIVTPGIRPEWAAKGDQKRVLTPGQALSEGADYLVVGRPVIADRDPLGKACMVLEELSKGTG